MTPDDFSKAAEIIRKTREYNKNYYAANKKQESSTPKNNSGRKVIEELTTERAAEILRKYKLKCQSRNAKLNTPAEIKQEISKLFTKLKKLMPDKS